MPAYQFTMHKFRGRSMIPFYLVRKADEKERVAKNAVNFTINDDRRIVTCGEACKSIGA